MDFIWKTDRVRSVKTGFTLMEIIIAMAIFAIITGALLGNFFTSLTKGRDSRRKQDLDLTAKALELYYNDHKAYPTGSLPWGSPLSDGTTTYMQVLPKDPKAPGINYYYVIDPLSAGAYYKLYACLENKNDSAFKDYASTSCGACGMGTGADCTYGISSLNTTP